MGAHQYRVVTRDGEALTKWLDTRRAAQDWLDEFGFEDEQGQRIQRDDEPSTVRQGDG